MINKILEQNENIIYTSKANPGKTSIQIFRIILIGCVLTLFYYLLFFNHNNMGLFNWTTCLIVLFLLTILTIYGIIYNLILKHMVKNDIYYITNDRIILINGNKVLVNSIKDVNFIGIAREKNSYGDITFHFNVDINKPLNNLVGSKKEVKRITFSGVKNPRELIEIITKTNKNVFVYDDRPKILSNKM